MTDFNGADDLPRRTALKAGLAAGLTGLLLPALSGCTPEDRPDIVTVAGGEPGGFYLEFAGLLAESLQRYGAAGHAAALTTGGSLDNIEFLLSGKATFAIALSDAAAQRSAAGDTNAVAISAVGKVYENYIHCVVRRDSGIRDIAGLAGRIVAVGEPGSGTSLTTPRLIEAAGLAPRLLAPAQLPHQEGPSPSSTSGSTWVWQPCRTGPWMRCSGPAACLPRPLRPPTVTQGWLSWTSPRSFQRCVPDTGSFMTAY